MTPTSQLRVSQARPRASPGLWVLGLSSRPQRGGTWWLAGVWRRVSRGGQIYPKGELGVVGRMRQLNTGPHTENGTKVAGPALGPGWRGGASTLPPPPETHPTAPLKRTHSLCPVLSRPMPASGLALSRDLNWFPAYPAQTLGGGGQN